MRYGIPKAPEPRPCCKPDCGMRATWTLVYGPSPDDYNDSCDAHVAWTLGDSPMHSAQRLEAPAVDHLDVVFDGPPGPESGRFVELEGFYGAFPPERIEGVGGPDWVQDGDLWRLRIPIPGGWLYG